MAPTRSSRETKRALLRCLLFDGQQPCKLVVDPRLFGADDTGFPERVVEAYPEGIPLDLDPNWPLDLDLDSEFEMLSLNLSFSGRVCRCRIPWAAVAMIAAGMGSAAWVHEAPQAEESPPPHRKGRGGHLHLVD